MAIDLSVRHGETQGGGAGKVVEGADILGLAADDDIGEKYLTVKRVRRDVTTTADEAVRTGLLTEAPVPTLVADPGNDRVANDSGTGAAVEPGTIKEYVASVPDLEDDEAFDKYLLAGEHLARPRHL